MLMPYMSSGYLKAVARQIAADGASRETLREFQSGQGPAIKKIMDHWETFDVFMTPSMDVHGMYVCLHVLGTTCCANFDLIWTGMFSLGIGKMGHRMRCFGSMG